MYISIPSDSSRDLLQEDEFMIEDEYLLTPSQLNTLAKIDEQDASQFYFEQKEKEKIGLHYD